mgnify:CR=1 FL=1
MNDGNENEFSHLLRLDQIHGQSLALTADTEERAALAVRFGLQAIDMLGAQLSIARRDHRIELIGEMQARAVQSCTATGAPVMAEIAEPLRIDFIPQPDHAPDAEIELDDSACDVMFYDGANIDIGEAVAQSFALALDPYPRSSDAADTLKHAGVKNEEEAGPFGALADLKAKLEKDV